MTQNHNKNITQITYNHLNLPKKISFQNNNYIEYTYDASGIKVRKKVTENNTISVTDYLDGFQYNNSKLQFFPHAEGYVKHTTTGSNDEVSIFNYIYQYKDHLGNVRVNYTLENGSLVILDEHHYYPFGLEHGSYNPTRKEFRKAEDGGNNDIVVITEVENSGYQYKYNGKELQDELGLSVYDYGARIYDPAAPRFWQIDPKAEEMRRWSPYAYVYDNPIYFIDPDGMKGTDWYENKETGETVWFNGSKNYKGYENKGHYYTKTDVNGNKTFYNGDTKTKSENGVVTKDYNKNAVTKTANWVGENVLSPIAEGAQILGHIAVGTAKLFSKAVETVSSGGDVEGLSVEMEMPMLEINNGEILITDLSEYSEGEIVSNGFSALSTGVSANTGVNKTVDKVIGVSIKAGTKKLITKATEKK